MNKKRTLWIKGAWYAASIVFALIMVLYFVVPVNAWNTGAVYGLNKTEHPEDTNNWVWKNAAIKGYGEGQIIPMIYVIDSKNPGQQSATGEYVATINYDYKKLKDGKLIFGIDYLTTYPDGTVAETSGAKPNYLPYLPADATGSPATLAIPTLAGDPAEASGQVFGLYNGTYVSSQATISELAKDYKGPTDYEQQRSVELTINHPSDSTPTYLTFGSHLAASKYTWGTVWDGTHYNRIYTTYGASWWNPNSENDASLHMDSFAKQQIWHAPVNHPETTFARNNGQHNQNGNNGNYWYQIGNQWYEVVPAWTEAGYYSVGDTTGKQTLPIKVEFEYPGPKEPEPPTEPTAPVAVDDAYTTPFDTRLEIGPFPGIMGNDHDTNIINPVSPMTVAFVTGVSHGLLTLNPDGTFTYTPTTGFSGTDSFTYKVWNGYFYSNVATVTITIEPPIIIPDNGPTIPGGPTPQEMVPGNPTALENAGQLAEEGCGNFLIVDQYGQLNRYPCKDNGALCVTMEILSPDGQALFVAEAGTLVLSADGTPAYLKEGPQLIAAVKGMKPPKDMKVLSVYDFTPAGLTFDPPATVAIKYDPAKVPGNSSVTVAFLNENGQISEMETAGYVAEDISLPYTIIGLVPTIDNIIVLAAPLKQ